MKCDYCNKQLSVDYPKKEIWEAISKNLDKKKNVAVGISAEESGDKVNDDFFIENHEDKELKVRCIDCVKEKE